MSGSSKLIPVVLIVGDRDVGKCTLASRILKKELSHTEQLREHAFTWELDTKYYKASILLKYEQIGATCQTRVQPPIEGLILLLDGFRQETWNAAREWMSAFEQDPAVRLCVINKCEQCLASSPRPAWHEEVREWCVDNSFECVQVSCLDSEADRALGDDMGEGVARVVEALEAHIWPGMRRKGRLSSDSAPASSRASGDGGCDAEPTRGAGEGTGPRQERGAEPALRPTLEEEEEEEPAARLVDTGGDSESDGELGELGKLMFSLAEHRQRLAGLSDEERRARAADLALQMLKVMEADSESGEDDLSGGD